MQYVSTICMAHGSVAYVCIEQDGSFNQYLGILMYVAEFANNAAAVHDMAVMNNINLMLILELVMLRSIGSYRHMSSP